MKKRPPVPEKGKRVLFLKSRNKCAFPGCDNALVALPEGGSPHKIIGEICHIHSGKEGGPRARTEQTDDEYNADENLIVLCPTHHTKVDGQPEAYTAETLKEWKKTHESKAYKVSPEGLNAPPEDFYFRFFPTALVDQTIEEEADILRKARFFVGFDGAGRALAFSRRLLEGDLHGGTNETRAEALVWCARILAGRDRSDRAEECLEEVESLGGDTRYAKAFIFCHKEDKSKALSVLADDESPTGLSARLTIVGHHDGPEVAMGWFENSAFRIADLDPDGKFILLKYQLELGQWEPALESAKSQSESDFDETPILHYMAAVAYLISTVPSDYRTIVTRHLPFNAPTIPLASDAVAIAARRTALKHYLQGAEAARQFQCPEIALELERYSLWLELRDPELHEGGRQRLEGMLRDLKTALHLVPLGLSYGICLDAAEIEREIEVQVARRGEVTQEIAFARLAVARTQKTPEDIANYIDRHYDSLSPPLDRKAIRSSQIEMLAKAGLSERANHCLQLLQEEVGLNEEEESRLRIVIEEGDGEDKLEAHKSMFVQSGHIIDLEAVVEALKKREEWVELCEYGEILFAKTRSLQAAEGLAEALHYVGKSAQAVELLESNADIMSQSWNLQVLYCWALFHEGELLRARRELAKLEANWENGNYRRLQIHLAIYIGDWDSLSSIVVRESGQIENRTSAELLEMAHFSLYLKSNYARDFLFAAVDKGDDDAGILAGAYFLATRAGWEDREETESWLHRAAGLSEDDGPLWKVTLTDILDMKPEWDRQESVAREVLSRGEGPLAMAGLFLSRSLIELTLIPALANSTKRDLRRKVGISAYSGKRRPTPLTTWGTVGLDYTALLSLSFLGLLEKVFDALDAVYVPHATLAWLFEERQNASFHQPSRIEGARQIIFLFANRLLREFSQNVMPDGELSALVGDDLAAFIAEAENADPGETQRLVVRPSPVYKATALGEEEADLVSHFSVLISCQTLVETLGNMAEINDNLEKNALAYLQLHEKPWPDQPDISERAILYLDDLAVFYLLHTGILEKLCQSSFQVFVSSGLVAESNALIAYEGLSDKVVDAIENLRTVVGQGLESGKVKAGKWHKIVSDDEDVLNHHHIAGLYALVGDCDAIVVDDRFFNHCLHLKHEGASTLLLSTLDLLDALTSSGSIEQRELLNCRTNLRSAGFYFIPVTEDELTCHLNDTRVKDGKVIERIDLKAIRESILHVRMNDWLQPPELAWLGITEKAMVSTLRVLWGDEVEIPKAIARSNWIVDQLDIDNGDNVLEAGRGQLILALLVPSPDASPKVRSLYKDWAEERILVRYKYQFPDFYAWIVAQYKNRIVAFANQEQFDGLNMADVPNIKVLSALAMLDLAPPLIRETLLDDGQIWEEARLNVASVLTFEALGVSFQRSELYNAIRRKYSGATNVKMIDADGQEWTIDDESEMS